MILRADLHIHSCLSPCADADMTPNNLVNMAWLKGLDAIAVADHNSARNLPACQAVADARGLVFLPAIEANTQEDVHLLCYLPTVADALMLGDWLYERIPPVLNKPGIFGEQCVCDAQDACVDTVPKLLIQAVQATLAEVAARVWAMGGVAVPAHINRGANSLLSALGMFPSGLRLPAVEVSPHAPPPAVDLSKYSVLRSSDAHRLEDIAEGGMPLPAAERTPAGILAYLRAGG
ncbi:MAG: PHP domain-containing protein [Oscillospiraceae bacterium]|jgi:hypothetical protein|nr:PHP domain-containing protein [Oscillospiraceae bacterium]